MTNPDETKKYIEGFKDKDLDPEKYEWVIRKKSKETIEEEERIKSRLAKAGY